MPSTRLLALLVLLAVPLAQADSAASPAAPAATDLKVGFYEFPPSIYTDDQGRPAGRMYQLAERMLRRAGYTPSFRSLPSPRLYNGLVDGSIHLWVGASGKAGLEAHTLESRHELARMQLNLYHLPQTPRPRIPEDLRGSEIILISGYTYWPKSNQLLQDPTLGLHLHRTSSHQSALQMLLRSRGQFLLDYNLPTDQAVQELQLEPLPHVVLEELSVRYIISRKAPAPEALRDALDRVYEQMRAAGEPLGLP